MSDEPVKNDENTDKVTSEEKKTEEKKVETPVEAQSAVETPKEESKKDPQKTQEEKSVDTAEDVIVPKQFKKLIEDIEKMSVIELSELVKILEKKFGVSASVAAPVANTNGAVEEEGSSTVTVELSSFGANKIAVIKAVKDILSLGLKDAKDIVDGAPSILKEGIKKEEAEELKSKIETAGGTITFK